MVITVAWVGEIDHNYSTMDRISHAEAGFQDSDFFQKALKMLLICNLSVISHLSGVRL